jgi:hypothetical protein
MLEASEVWNLATKHAGGEGNLLPAGKALPAKEKSPLERNNRPHDQAGLLVIEPALFTFSLILWGGG